MIYIGDISRWREDMNFMFEWQEQYHTRSLRSLVRYCSCHSHIKFISSRQRVMFFLLYRHTNDGVIDDFPKISDHFPKIAEDFSKIFPKVARTLLNISENFRRLKKIAEDCRRHSRKTRRYFDHTPTILSTI